jgi:ATP-dependent helicase Lhr and Lhr-like helicase
VSAAPAQALAPFHPLVADWFARAFAAPTPAQSLGWPAIASGAHTLVLAPTGSGKTLAAFLWGLNQLIEERLAGRTETRLLYLSPLKALNYDVERNLRGPLAGLTDAARRRGLELPPLSVAVRTGDTPQAERARMLRKPPDILITTPESLYLLLTSRGAEILSGVRFAIVDEVHAVAATKRGAHLALSLERLERAAGGPVQRIGLSATQRPLEEIGRFLGGRDDEGRPRPVTIVDAGSQKELDVQVLVPLEDMSDLSGPATPLPDPLVLPGSEPRRRSIWPAIYPELLRLVREHTSTLIFVNNRRLAERLALRLNELAEEEIARAHHGSVAREQRTLIEEELKAGRLRALVATSSLELGIDMGAVDLVIQVESPRSVARGIQRIGRAGHQVGAPSRGRIFPKHRGDLLESAAVVARMHAGAIEETRIPRQPLDVLAQQIVACCANESWSVDDLHAMVRRAHPFAELSRDQLEGVLDMLAGRYPSDEFAELSPRIVWDRIEGTVRGRAGARSLAVQNAGTIPDRGLFGVYLADGRSRVGELDEEMVYEARAGQTFLLGASTWRIEEITRDRVIVSPAPGVPGAVPFWKGEGIGRPYELGAAVGRLARELTAADPAAASARLRAESGFDERAAANLLAYLADQAQATGAVPSDTTIVVERFRDEVGDWRMCVLSPFGGRVHAPWALALQSRLRGGGGPEAQLIWSDDGIAIHLPDAEEPPGAELVLLDPEELDELVLGELGGTALFGARFRENAARALLIPRRRPGRRTPLWQQRLKAQSLLAVARRFGSFPIILETYRECLDDWFDLPALRDLLRRVQRRQLAVVEVETAVASPFAGSLLFEYIASYMYEDDTPPAERRAQALALNRDLLRELLGQEELRELIDADALAAVEEELQWRTEPMRARDADRLHDLLRRLGDLTPQEVRERLAEPDRGVELLEALRRERRAVPLRLANEERWIAAEDAGRYRDALGAMPPAGLPDAFLGPVPDALRSLLARYARARGPFLTEEAAGRFGIAPAAAAAELRALEASGGLVRGELRPGGREREWCDAEVLRRLRRASLAALRREVEPVDQGALARFLPAWQGIDRASTLGAPPAPERLREALGPLQGLALAPAQWEEEVFPRRLGAYSPAWLDALVSSGEAVWVGAGAAGRDGGRVALYFREDAPLLGPPPAASAAEGEAVEAVRAALAGGAAFWEEILDAVPEPREEVFRALWALVWAGEVTNDLWMPLRAPKALPRPRPAPRPGARRIGAARAAPSAAAGRWSLTARLFARAPAGPERRRALAELMLERHGVVTRAAALADGVPGGFAGIYAEMGELETLGRCRRGYFVDGLGGAQFALPGAVERLRDLREAGAADETPGPALVLGAADPAQPYGAALPWPRRPGGRSPARAFGAQVVLQGGLASLYLERGGRSLVTLRDPDPAWLEPALEALAAWVAGDRRRRVALERVDGQPVFESPLEPALVAAGFRPGVRDLVLRA